MLTSIQANAEDAIAGLLNSIIAESLPSRTNNGDQTACGCDRSTGISAQAGWIEPALTEVVETLLEAIDLHEGGIRWFDLGGLMTGPDRCTIWGQACVEHPARYQSLVLDALVVRERPGQVEIITTLRAVNRER